MKGCGDIVLGFGMINHRLFSLIPVLFIIGKWFKGMKNFDNSLIPITLGVIGVTLSLVWMFATSDLATVRDGFILKKELPNCI